LFNPGGLGDEAYITTMGMAAVIVLLRDVNLVLLIIQPAIAYFALFLAPGRLYAIDREILRNIWNGIKGRTIS
jgi:hypothetical protein